MLLFVSLGVIVLTMAGNIWNQSFATSKLQILNHVLATLLAAVPGEYLMRQYEEVVGTLRKSQLRKQPSPLSKHDVFKTMSTVIASTKLIPDV